jgi:hypothetical protein
MTALIAFTGFLLVWAGVSEISIAEPLTWWKVGIAMFGCGLVWAAGFRKERIRRV